MLTVLFSSLCWAIQPTSWSLHIPLQHLLCRDDRTPSHQHNGGGGVRSVRTRSFFLLGIINKNSYSGSMHVDKISRIKNFAHCIFVTDLLVVRSPCKRCRHWWNNEVVFVGNGSQQSCTNIRSNDQPNLCDLLCQTHSKWLMYRWIFRLRNIIGYE